MTAAHVVCGADGGVAWHGGHGDLDLDVVQAHPVTVSNA